MRSRHDVAEDDRLSSSSCLNAIVASLWQVKK
jgi:hypothetical protein